MTCLVHDIDNVSLKGILERLGDSDRIVTFVLDLAEHVVELAPAPKKSKRWLDVARRRKDENTQVAIEAARLTYRPAWKRVQASVDAQWDEKARAAETIFEALKASLSTRDGKWFLAIEIADSAQAARMETNGSEAEADWQLARARALFCTCPKMPEAAPADGPRSRPSTLTSGYE